MAIISRNPFIRLDGKGVTLVELMITIVIASFATAAIIMAFRSQDASSLVQETVTSMQQNNIAAMDIMTQELRMAGYDPTGGGIAPPAAGYTATATIPTATIALIQASSSSLRFTMDLDGDGLVTGSDEDVTYGFKTTTPSDDANSDGIADSGLADLRRKTGNGTGGGMQSMAEGVEAFNFAYAYDADGDGVLETSAGGNTIWGYHSGGVWFNLDTNDDGIIDAADGPGLGNSGAIAGVSTGTSSDVNDVRAVRIWILARSNRQDAKYNNTNTYVVGRQVITPNDKFYRRLLTTTVTCRNQGL